MDFIFNAQSSVPALVERSGKFFECGDYPDKKFPLNEAEADAVIAGFQPVDLELEHQTSQGLKTILTGKLGQISKDLAPRKDAFRLRCGPAVDR